MEYGLRTKNLNFLNNSWKYLKATEKNKERNKFAVISIKKNKLILEITIKIFHFNANH